MSRHQYADVLRYGEEPVSTLLPTITADGVVLREKESEVWRQNGTGLSLVEGTKPPLLRLREEIGITLTDERVVFRCETYARGGLAVLSRRGKALAGQLELLSVESICAQRGYRLLGNELKLGSTDGTLYRFGLPKKVNVYPLAHDVLDLCFEAHDRLRRHPRVRQRDAMEREFRFGDQSSTFELPCALPIVEERR